MRPNEVLFIDNVEYKIQEAIPAGVRGRIYKVISPNKEPFALLVLSEPFNTTKEAEFQGGLNRFANIPGLSICRRKVVTLEENKGQILWAVLFPWIEGPLLAQVLQSKQVLTEEQSLVLARSLAKTLSELEKLDIIFVALDAKNIAIPYLAETVSNIQFPIELIDVDSLQQQDRQYSNNWLPANFVSNRLHGSILIALILGWCIPIVRENTKYPPSAEIERDSKWRSDLLKSLSFWGKNITDLFQKTWDGTEYVSFTKWFDVLDEVNVSEPLNVFYMKLRNIKEFVSSGWIKEALDELNKLRKVIIESKVGISGTGLLEKIKEIETELGNQIATKIDTVKRNYDEGQLKTAWILAQEFMSSLGEQLKDSQYFKDYYFRFEALYYQLREAMEKEIDAERGLEEALRMRDRYELAKATKILSELRDRGPYSSRILHNIENLYNDLRGIKNFTLAQPKNDVQTVELLKEILTPQYLGNEIVPYLKAIGEIQSTLNILLGQDVTQFAVKVISQNSPVGVSLEGVSDTVLVFIDIFIPWKRKHAEKMAEYARREKQYEIEKKRVELNEANLQIIKGQKEIEKVSVEIFKMKQEAEKLKIENEKAKSELLNVKVELGLKVLNRITPNLNERERISALMKLLPSLDTLVACDIEMLVIK